MSDILLPTFVPVKAESADYPVNYTSWFNAIEYCNRRSMLEGYEPCYSYALTGHTDPLSWPEGWDQNDANYANIICDWNASGYRLPTEAEWTFAARGGNDTHGWNYSGNEFIDTC